jgi:hypothetical protein
MTPKHPGALRSSRYPRIRKAYAGQNLVQALDRVEQLQHSDGMVQLIVVRYLDVLEEALAGGMEHVTDRGCLLSRSLEAVNEALEAFGLLETLPN